MSKSSSVLLQYVLPRSTHRNVSTSCARRASTSPQRKTAPAPAVSDSVKPFTDIPGPLALPMLRHSAHVLPRIGSFHHAAGLGLLEGLRNRYGDLVRLAKASRKRPALYVFDPEMMREIYESRVTEPPRWDNSPLCQHRKTLGSRCPVHGNENQAIWAAIRTFLQDKSLLKNYDQIFQKISADATLRLGKLGQAENALNEEFETEIYRWALETIGVMILGIRLGCLDGNTHVPTMDNRTPEKTSLHDDILDLCSLTKRSAEELSLAERLIICTKNIADGNFLVRSECTLKTDSQTFNEALIAFDRHFSLTEHFLQKALLSLDSEIRPEQALLDKLRPLDRRILPLAADILLAGVDPLAQTAIAMLYHLSLNPARQQRAHDEVLWAKASLEAGAGCPELPYLAACATEAMRMHPVTGGVVRRSKEELIVGGYEVPPGVDIILAHGVSSKSEKEWARAKAFIPERWCSEGWEPLKASRAHSYSSMPFGESCPATGIIGNMLTSLATNVLDKYRIEWHGPAPNLVTTGVNKLQRPYYFVLQKAA